MLNVNQPSIFYQFIRSAGRFHVLATIQFSLFILAVSKAFVLMQNNTKVLDICFVPTMNSL